MDLSRGRSNRAFYGIAQGEVPSLLQVVCCYDRETCERRMKERCVEEVNIQNFRWGNLLENSWLEDSADDGGKERGSEGRNRRNNLLQAGSSGDRIWWEREFPHPSSRGLGPTQPPVKLIPCVFPGGKEVGAWRWPSTPI